ncbi:unnamed protein product [Polarella glacialis]|uniref:Citrate transporter-like domain-containing protein n=1 Tax=Polarella glacialis TaxID=89957 RepID=A0A813HIS5_POLGL|nr:unnamed protein product [Polarella glacialis]
MSMPWQSWVVLATLSVTLVVLFLEKGSPEQIMLGALVLLWNIGIVSTSEALNGFANPALISIGALFLVMQALDKSKIIERLARRVLDRSKTERSALLCLCLTTFILSALFNNTPLVVLFMPIVRDWARRREQAPSKFLIPLSYSSIMGGTLTTIGSSTNLLVNGLLEQAGYVPFGFLDPSKASLPVGVIGLAFLVLAGPRLLPKNKGGLFREVREHGDNLVTALEITDSSQFVGKSAADVLLKCGLPSASLLKIRRRLGCAAATTPQPSHVVVGASQLEEVQVDMGGTASAGCGLGENDSDFNSRFLSLDIGGSSDASEDSNILEVYPVPPHELAQAGDVFLLSLPRDIVMEMISKSESGIKVCSMHANDALSSKSEFVELVLAAQSKLTGQPVSSGAQLTKQLYNSGLVAIRRRTWGTSSLLGTQKKIEDPNLFEREASSSELQSASFTPGDVLLVLAEKGVEFPKSDFLLVTRLGDLEMPVTMLDYVPLLLFVAGLILTALDIAPMVQVSLTLVMLFMLGGWIKAADVRTAVDSQLLILIGSALGISVAIQKSGLAQNLAQAIFALDPPRALVPALLFLVIMLITELVTNNAAAAIGVPIAIALSKELGLASPHPLVMTVMLAASTAYASPIGYATNLMVMGPGGYSFLDFFRIGACMDLIWLVGISIMIPLTWPLI